MGYSTTAEVDLILGQALTSAKPELSPTQRVKLINIGNTRDFNLIPETTVNYYIELADSQIDGILNQIYFTPFKKCVHGQWSLDEDLNGTAGTGNADTSGQSSSTKTVAVSSSVNLVPGDEILIHDASNGGGEIHVVESIVDQYTFKTVDDITGTYSSDTTLIKRLRFPPPLNQISARYAASFIYDKYFASQAEPNISDYGKEMRKVAMGQLNDILNGKTVLDCAERRGDLFGNPWLNTSYGVIKPYDGFATSDRDMSAPK